MLGPRLAVDLLCPGCGEERVLRPGECWLLCLGCRQASEAGGGGVLPLVWTRPFAGPSGPVIAFFRYASPRITARDLAVETVLEPLTAGSPAWVLAMRVRGFTAFGDAGMEYTRRPPRFDPGPPGEMPLALTRGLGDAEAVLLSSLARRVAEAAPLSGATLTLEAGTPEIWCVTTQADGGHVKFPHTGIRVPLSSLS